MLEKVRNSKTFKWLAVIWSVIVALGAFFATPIGERVFDSIAEKIETIEISSISTRDTPMVVNGVEMTDNVQKETLGNYLEHDITFEGERNLHIDQIKLTNVNISKYEYSDVSFHFGFNQSTQEYVAYILENGNKNTDYLSYQYELTWNDNKNQKSKIIKEEDFKIEELKGSEIKKALSIDTKSNDILSIFKENSSQMQTLTIDILDSKSEKVATKILIYDSTKQNFKSAAWGSTGPTNDRQELILFRLLTPYDKEYSLTVDENISSDDSLAINVLFDKTAHYDYDIEIISDNKTIKSKDSKNHISVDVYMPNYRLVGGGIRGYDSSQFYQLMSDNNLSSVTKEYVKNISPTLIYTYKNTEKDYNIAK